MEFSIKFPTGIHDIDREILFHVSDEELYAICVTNKYMQQVCNENFWRNKFIRKFGIDLDKYSNKSYKILYRELKSLNNEQLLKISSKKEYLPLIKLLIENGTNIHSEHFVMLHIMVI
jgi:hypothetical protein